MTPADEKAVAEMFPCSDDCQITSGRAYTGSDHTAYCATRHRHRAVDLAARIRAEAERESKRFVGLLRECEVYIGAGIVDYDRAKVLLSRIDAALAAKAGM